MKVNRHGTARLANAVGLATLLSVWLEPPPAKAENGAVPIHIEFRADPSCPDGAAFLGSLLAQTARVRWAEAQEAARTFQVTISRTETGQFTGQLSVTRPQEPSRAPSQRAINGRSCAEVFDALILFALLAIDPDAVPAPAPPKIAPSPPATPARPQAIVPAESQRTPSRPESKSTLRGLAGAHVGAMSAGDAPSVLLIEPFVGWAQQRVHTTGLLLSAAVRAGFSSTGTDVPNPAGSAHLHWTTWRLDGCPLELRAGPTFSVRPCLAGSLGIFSSVGEIAQARSHQLSWLTLGALIRAEWNFAGVFSLEADAGFDAPLRRDQLYFDPSTPVYRAPAALGRISAGLAIRFP